MKTEAGMMKVTMWTGCCVVGVSLVLLACGGGGTDGPTADAAVPDTAADTTVPEDTVADAAADTTIPPTVPGEKVACGVNTSFEALLPILKGGKTHPTGRGEQGAAYDVCNARIVLFGGNDFQPEQCASFGPKRFQGDTWIYSVEHENWARLEPANAPSARGRQDMVFDASRKQVLLFGGRFRPESQSSGAYTLYNDLWAFDVNTDTWSEVNATGDVPSPRINSAMVYDTKSDKVLLFGGSTSTSGLTFAPQADTYVYDPETQVWTRLSTDVAPPARLFHRMIVDTSHDRILLYAGGDENAWLGPFYNDLWAFSMSGGTWQQLWQWDGPGTGPDARIYPAFVDDPARGRVVMFAGHDDTSVGNRNDVWSFDAGTGQWTSLRAGDTGAGVGCSSFCTCPPDFVDVDMESPERRGYHTFIAIPGEDRAIMFGGKSDCGYLDDTWSLSLTDAEWTEIEPAGQGEACKRSGQEGCTDLCY